MNLRRIQERIAEAKASNATTIQLDALSIDVPRFSLGRRYFFTSLGRNSPFDIYFDYYCSTIYLLEAPDRTSGPGRRH